MNPVGRSLYRDYNKRLDIWNLDHRGSLGVGFSGQSLGSAHLIADVSGWVR